MPHPLLIFSLSDCLIPDCCYKFTYFNQIVAIDSHTYSSEANRSGSTLFAKARYIRIQHEKGSQIFIKKIIPQNDYYEYEVPLRQGFFVDFMLDQHEYPQSIRSLNQELYCPIIIWHCIQRLCKWASLGHSVGCVQPPPRSATFFRGDWSWNIFYGHSLPSADSRRAVVSSWQKNVHNTG